MVSVAVVGCGYWGRNLVRNFAGLEALSAVVDPNPEQAAKYAAEYKVQNLSFDEVLANPSIQAVAISAPAEQHYDLANRALLADKHVYVEKPLALDVREAEALCDLAESRGRVLMVGHLLQYHPAFLALKKLVDDGRLGRLQYIYSNRLNLGKVRREENILWSFAPHDVSMILSLVGAEPNAVEATGAAFLHNEIADVTTTHLSFPGGERAHIFVSWLHPFKEQKLVVVGSSGMGVFDDGEPWERKVQVYPHQIHWKEGMPVPEKAEGEYLDVEPDEPLKLECAHFLECAETGKTPRTDGHEGVRVLRVLQQSQASLDEGTKPAGKPEKRSPSADDVMIHESAYVDEPVEIGAGTRIWHFSHILGNTTIGKDCVVSQNVMIGPDVTVGDRCKIQNNVSLYKGVTLDDGVFCGPSCVFTNVNNPRAEIERKNEYRPTHVGKGATIGANATIVCGHDLGAYCFIAAGAVVATDVPPFALMAGVPAKQIGWMSHDGEKLGDDLVCPRSGRKYRVEQEQLIEDNEGRA